MIDSCISVLSFLVLSHFVSLEEPLSVYIEPVQNNIVFPFPSRTFLESLEPITLQKTVVAVLLKPRPSQVFATWGDFSHTLLLDRPLNLLHIRADVLLYPDLLIFIWNLIGWMVGSSGIWLAGSQLLMLFITGAEELLLHWTCWTHVKWILVCGRLQWAGPTERQIIKWKLDCLAAKRTVEFLRDFDVSAVNLLKTAALGISLRFVSLRLQLEIRARANKWPKQNDIFHISITLNALVCVLQRLRHTPVTPHTHTAARR